VPHGKPQRAGALLRSGGFPIDNEMSLVFEEAHAAPEKKKVNEEWFVVANVGGAAINTAGLNVVVAKKGKRGSVLGQIDPGFVLQPGEKILVVTGTPGKKSQGIPPEKPGMRTYHLFAREPLLAGNGSTVRLTLNQMEVARVTYDKTQASGVAPQSEPQGS